METSFTIFHEGREILAETGPDIQPGEKMFIVHLPGEDLYLHLQEDSDGANRWLDAQKNHETELSKAIGDAIDLYIMQSH